MNSTETVPRRYRALDVLVYALAVTVLVFVLSAVVSTLLGAGWFGVELLMFVIGWLLFGYGTLLLRPSAKWRTEETDTGFDIKRTETEPDGRVIGSREETRFQSAVQQLPPLRWYSIPPEERPSVGAKIFVSGVAVLLASFVLERLVVA